MTLGRRGQEQFSGTRYYCTTAPTVIISDTFLSRQAGEVSTIIYDTVVDVAEMQHQVAPKTLRDKIITARQCATRLHCTVCVIDTMAE